MYTPTTEDYLKAIYTLQHKFDLVETSVLAKYLTVAASSATSRIQKMDDLGFERTPAGSARGCGRGQ